MPLKCLGRLGVARIRRYEIGKIAWGLIVQLFGHSLGNELDICPFKKTGELWRVEKKRWSHMCSYTVGHGSSFSPHPTFWNPSFTD